MLRPRIGKASWILFAGLGATPIGCEQPNSIELGQPCKGSAQCRTPADTCLTIGTASRCSMPCATDSPCPDGYACAVTQPATRTRGMCLPNSAVSSSTVTVK